LPSSLTRVLSRAWVSSTRLPVSVCGTVGVLLARGFSRHLFPLVRVGCNPFASPHATLVSPTDLPIGQSCAWTRTTNPGQRAGRCVPPSLITKHTGHGISTVQPSATPFGFALGPTNLQRTNLPEEPLGFRRTGFSPVFSLLIPAFSLPPRPPLLTVRLLSTTERSPTPHDKS
jgi:hypothetical protein